MLTAWTALCFVWLGFEISMRLWRDELSVLELWCASLAIGSLLWLGSVWAASLFHCLDRNVMLFRTGVATILAVLLWTGRKKPSRSDRAVSRNAILLYIIPSVPVMIWLVFILWRSTVVPPVSHDALSYHLPRAVLFTRLHGYDHLDFAVDARLRTLPANYEMLLADVLLLERGDRITEWVATFFYFAFIVACGALVWRWWRDFLPAFASMMLIASVPVLLLHAGADKNDTMGAFFMVCGLVFGGRWVSQGDQPALMLTLASLAGGIGAKPQAALFGLCLTPFLVRRLVMEWRGRRLSQRFIVACALVCLSSILLLGGVAYVANFRRSPVPIDVRIRSDAQPTRGIVPYGDWVNLWQAPWVLITAPFSGWSDALYVPWETRPWWWKRYELYFSHLGAPFAICGVLLAGAVYRYRSDVSEARSERAVGSVVAAAALLLMIPVRFIPHGMYLISLPRYALFIVPVVFGWTIAPSVRRLASSGLLYAGLFLYLAAAWFTYEAREFTIHDAFAPLDYVTWAAGHPGTRVIPFDQGRAASVVDQIAAQHDKIALDVGFGAWIHPAFGVSLLRPVDFIAPGEGAPQISSDARWVVIDESWHVFWEQDGFRDLSQAWTFISKGKPSAQDTRVFRYLSADPRFEVVYSNPARNQAVFRRRRPS